MKKFFAFLFFCNLALPTHAKIADSKVAMSPPAGYSIDGWCTVMMHAYALRNFGALTGDSDAILKENDWIRSRGDAFVNNCVQHYSSLIQRRNSTANGHQSDTIQLDETTTVAN